MSPFTEIELVWVEGRVERWLRFGRVASERIVDRQRRIAGIAPGSVFALVRWDGNDQGTRLSQIFIVRVPRANEPAVTVPGVTPGGEVLLRLSGWRKVAAALAAIDDVEARGVRPEDVCPDHWRQVHNRLNANRTPDPYGKARHRAWLLRRAVAS